MFRELSNDDLQELITTHYPTSTDTVSYIAGLSLKLRAENAILREALSKIAVGDGYYGNTIRDYKEIARKALKE